MGHVETFSSINGTLEEKCQEFAAILGLNEPVAPEVLEAALESEEYARNLLTSRRHPLLLVQLLKNPPKKRSVASPAAPAKEWSNTELLKKASTALVNWGKTGFSTVDDTTLIRRRDACMSCPNLTDPPDKLVYKLPLAQRDRKKICSLCGCTVANKMRIPSESCPDDHPDLSGMTRWGEPVK